MFNDTGGFFSVIFALLMVVGILFLAYYVTRWLGKRTTIQSGSQHIKVLDRTFIGQDKCILIVNIKGRVLALAMTSHAVEILCELNADDFPSAPEPDTSFSTLLQRFIQKPSANGLDQGGGDEKK